MEKFIVIGLGNFGFNIAKSLVANRCEVLGIDSEKEPVEKAKDHLTHAIIGNPANKSVIQSLGVKDYDGVIVSIGQEMISSILIALYLVESGAKRIIARAISEDHEKILKQLGVTEVIFPERDMAIRMGKMISMKNALDYLPMTEDYSIMEMHPPASFVGKSLKELSIGARFRCQILGMKYNENPEQPGIHNEIKEMHLKTIIAPSADEKIKADYTLIVLGKTTSLEKMQKMD
jgi:trk system potassium uptake protein TrkA